MLRYRIGHHCSDECLVSLLDGEMAPRKRRAAQKHLDRCWECRTRMAEFESQIQQFTRRLRIQSDPPPAWVYRAKLRFQERARSIREMAENEPRSVRARWFSPLRLNPGVLAAATACLLVAVVVHWLQSPARVSAHELLQRAVASDLSTTRVRAGKVVRQRVQVRRKSLRTGQEMTAVRDCWFGLPRPVAEPAAGNSLMDELRGVYSTNGLDWDAPLAVASVARWRANLRSPSEHVSLSDNFVLTVEDRSASIRSDRQLRLIRLFLRPPDLHPVKQELETADARYGVSEVSYGVLDPPMTERASLSIPVHQSPRIARQTVELPPAPDPAAALADRIQVEFAIHEAGACLGATVTVDNLPDGRFAVRGIVDTDTRKQQLVEALSVLPAVTVLELQTIAEAARSAESTPGDHSPPANYRASMIFRSTSFALEKPLHTYFLKHGTQESAREQTGLLIDNLLGKSSDSGLEAAALKRLAEAYPAGKLVNLPNASRQLLWRMIHEHSRQLEQDFKIVRGSLFTVAHALDLGPGDHWPSTGSVPAGEPVAWERECEALPANISQLDARIWELLTHSPGLVEKTRDLIIDTDRSLQECGLRTERLTAAAAAFGDRIKTAENNRLLH